MSHSLPVFTSSALREVEARCVQQGIDDLMQRAGLVAAEAARRMLGDTAKSVLVLAGPGNNGGDAFEVACHLKDWFFRVTVFYAGDPAKLPADAKRAHGKWLQCGGATVPTIPDAAQGKFDLVVDGLFGIGLKRPPEGIYAEVIDTINHLGTAILALDVPSGIDADTGAKPGTAIRASRTITFIALKPGLLTLEGTDYSGEVELAGLGIAKQTLGESTGHTAGQTIGPDLFMPYLKPRPNNAHKGDMGSVAVIGGAAGMTGAALLASRAALKLGAGRVYCGLADEKTAITVDPCQLELMLRPASSLFEPGFAGSMVVGPGLGHSPEAHRLLESALASPLPLVLDADALNMIAAEPELARRLSAREHTALITPHPGEAARLLGKSIAEVQADRIASALELARRFHCVALLKGAGSVIATLDGRWFINTTGNPGMASAGMGDVLSGLLGTLLAQGWRAEPAMLAGVHLHACAADACVVAGLGPAGLTASDVTDAARTLFNQWCRS
jgi:hydroxyethylthiazole kinase-like uncharacterized protein yjeF